VVRWSVGGECSGLFRNGRLVTAVGRADPNRLNERDHPARTDNKSDTVVPPVLSA
jgi:hypothetical protein